MTINKTPNRPAKAPGRTWLAGFFAERTRSRRALTRLSDLPPRLREDIGVDQSVVAWLLFNR